MSTPLDTHAHARRPRGLDSSAGYTLTRPGVESRRAARASSSAGSIVINALLLYAAHHLLEWQVGWITPAWSDVLWAVDLTLEVSIVASALFLVISADWFRNLAGSISCATAVLATWWLYVIFPFDFGSSATNDLARLILTLVLIATVIATFVTALVAIVELLRAALRTTIEE